MWGDPLWRTTLINNHDLKPSHNMRWLISFLLVATGQKLLIMAQKETIKSMMRSAIKISLGIGVFFHLGLYAIPALAQESKNFEELSDEQYALLNILYSNKEKDRLKLYSKTIGDQSWVDLLLEYKWEEGILFCSFKNSELPAELDELPELSTRLSTKVLNKKKLSSKVKFRKKRKDESTQYISEPLINKNYAFILVRKPKSESVSIYYRDPKKGWIRECIVTISAVIECYFG